MRELPQARFNVDVKADGAGEELGRLVRQAGAEHRVLVASFSARRARAALRSAPGLAAAAPPWLIVASFLGGALVGPLLRSARRRGILAVQLPHRWGPFPLVTRARVRRWHAAGLQVHVWVVNDEAEAQVLLRRGVDGIMGDNAGLLQKVLAAWGAWPQQR